MALFHFKLSLSTVKILLKYGVNYRHAIFILSRCNLEFFIRIRSVIAVNLEWLNDYQDMLTQIRRDLHHFPEPGWCEFRTTSIIVSKLKKLGFKVIMGKELTGKASRMGVPPEQQLSDYESRAIQSGADPVLVNQMSGGFTGALATMSFSQGPTVAFRFDIDCVQVDEAETLEHAPYANGYHSTKKGSAHSCGHDGHTAIGLAFAEALTKIKNNLIGTVVLIFQPAEEGVRGAAAIIEGGALPKIDFMIGGHLGLGGADIDSFSAGSHGFLATSKFDIKLKGRASHAGNSPEKGLNALLAAANMAINLHAISRSAEGGTFINVGYLSAGSYRNIIAEKAEMHLEVRGENEALNTYMCEKAKDIIKGISNAYGVTYEILPVGYAINAISSTPLVQRIVGFIQEENIYTNIVESTEMVGSDDFSLFLKYVQDRGGQGTYMLWGAGIKNALHSGNYDFDESALLKALKTLLIITNKLLKREAEQERMH